MAQKHKEDHGGGEGSGVAVQESRPEVKEPPRFKVILLNDDFTPMDFVVEVLQTFFGMDHEKAQPASCCMYILVAKVCVASILVM